LEIKDVIFIEPYDGGSHRAFRQGLVASSRHRYECLVLPGRFWKWRMRGAAAWFADILNQGCQPAADLLFLTGFINVADLRGLLDPPLDRTPILLYMHENQLTYPLSPEEEFDFHFGFTNIISTLAADRVVFNSAWHRDLFLEAVPSYLNRMPEAVPKEVTARLEGRTEVLGVGLDRTPLPPDHFPQYRGGPCDPDVGPPWPRGRRPLLLWNHRWEFDKRPDVFAAAVNRLLDRGLDFDVALLGEPRGQEQVFAATQKRLGSRCLAFGHLPHRAEYDAMLARADIVVSCAEQEYFGIAVAEAVHAGCYPVLPRAQVYPSLYGTRCRGRHFYENEDELEALLADLVSGEGCGHVCSLDRDVDGYCWENLAVHFDGLIAAMAQAGRLKSTDHLGGRDRTRKVE
jgi:glycosyltransferase involved in cell wall biosynthesis